MMWARQTDAWDRQKRSVYWFLVGKPEGKRPLTRPRIRWKDNIKLIFKTGRYVD